MEIKKLKGMETRKVNKDGSIKYMGKKYLSKCLTAHIDETVYINPIPEVKALWVFDNSGSRICEAREKGIAFEKTFKSKEVGPGRDKLDDYGTDELIKELARRHGTSIIKIRNGCPYHVKGSKSRIKEEGPATIFVARGGKQ